ncbi:hypothetical protein BJ166DRAFT_370022 [Pestalotiopsis sp. NC0098]|nr:hypothetical protein BJ166DRAFT_370022 [Pestalotiopsis sp. NC0098]
MLCFQRFNFWLIQTTMPGLGVCSARKLCIINSANCEQASPMSHHGMGGQLAYTSTALRMLLASPFSCSLPRILHAVDQLQHHLLSFFSIRPC